MRVCLCCALGRPVNHLILLRRRCRRRSGKSCIYTSGRRIFWWGGWDRGEKFLPFLCSAPTNSRCTSPQLDYDNIPSSLHFGLEFCWFIDSAGLPEPLSVPLHKNKMWYMGLEAKEKESRDTCRIRRINKSKRLEMQRFYCFFKGEKICWFFRNSFLSSSSYAEREGDKQEIRINGNHLWMREALLGSQPHSCSFLG